MKFQPPFNEPDGTRWTNGNPAAGTRGSIVNALAIDHMQMEMAHLIQFAGETPSEVDLQQVRKAIQTLIQQALGGGAPGDYVTLASLGSLPIYPEILSDDGRINISSPAAGTILVPSGVAYRFRSVFNFNTSDIPEPQRLFTTLPNKIYHVVCGQTAGWSLQDLADLSYNPSQLPETDASLDGSYDRILAARVVTNSSNVATITLLSNSQRLRFQDDVGRFTNGINFSGASLTPYGTYSASTARTFPLSWARRPEIVAAQGVLGALDPGIAGLHGAANAITDKVISRYGISFSLFTDFHQGASGFYAEMAVQAVG